MKTVEYILTGSEIHLAAGGGVQRGIDALRHSRRDRYGIATGPCWGNNINGCLGELTLAKHFDKYWNGAFGDLNAADVGKQYQVRASEYDGPNAGLLLHDADRNDQPFFKALIRLPRVILMGWMWGREAKLTKFWSDKLQPGYPAFLVPHDLLRGMDDPPDFNDPQGGATNDNRRAG